MVMIWNLIQLGVYVMAYLDRQLDMFKEIDRRCRIASDDCVINTLLNQLPSVVFLCHFYLNIYFHCS